MWNPVLRTVCALHLLACILFPVSTRFYLELAGQSLTCALEPSKLPGVVKLIVVFAEVCLKVEAFISYRGA